MGQILPNTEINNATSIVSVFLTSISSFHHSDSDCRRRRHRRRLRPVTTIRVLRHRRVADFATTPVARGDGGNADRRAMRCDGWKESPTKACYVPTLKENESESAKQPSRQTMGEKLKKKVR